MNDTVGAKEHFVTLFDARYLPRGLALHASMVRHVKAFHLWIVAADQDCATALQRLSLADVTVLVLEDLLFEELAAVRSSRTMAEYLWTVTPHLFAWVFALDKSFQRLTYLDADVYFLKDPSEYFSSFGQSGASVGLTEHGYHPVFDATTTSGRFCVQFLTAIRGDSESILTRWAEQCREWCFNRFEGGKFGDQGYLTDWPSRYGDSVYIAEISGFQGPWNAYRFEAEKAIIFHFHGHLMTRRFFWDVGAYPIPRTHLRLGYRPYMRDIRNARSLMKGLGVGVQEGAVLREFLVGFVARTLSRLKIAHYNHRSNN